MTKAVLLPCSGDPFIASLAIKLWKERWYDEIDRLYINYNNHAEVSQEVVREFLGNCLDPKITIIYHPNGIEQGEALKELTLIAKEDLVMFLEEDGYIFNSGIVSRCFQMIENGTTDIVGSPRGSCGQEIWDKSKEKYGLDYSGYGDQGPNWWPNFFFCKRTDLLRTDLNFGSKKFSKGSWCQELLYHFKEDNMGDTFVWASVQLRGLRLRSQSVPQHHASPYEITDITGEIMNWHPSLQPFDWIHAGSLSAGWGGYLSGVIPNVSDDNAKNEIETRTAFWRIAMETTDGLDEFKKDYDKGLLTLVQLANLDLDRILKKIKIYRELMRL